MSLKSIPESFARMMGIEKLIEESSEKSWLIKTGAKPSKKQGKPFSQGRSTSSNALVRPFELRQV